MVREKYRQSQRRKKYEFNSQGHSIKNQ